VAEAAGQKQQQPAVRHIDHPFGRMQAGTENGKPDAELSFLVGRRRWKRETADTKRRGRRQGNWAHKTGVTSRPNLATPHFIMGLEGPVVT
jgi:hypothetical protein